MHRSEQAEVVSCAVCGAEVSVRSDRVFTFGTESALCWECSVRRGGRYDGTHERWEQAPDLADLADEEG